MDLSLLTIPLAFIRLAARHALLICRDIFDRISLILLGKDIQEMHQSIQMHRTSSHSSLLGHVVSERRAIYIPAIYIRKRDFTNLSRLIDTRDAL